MGRPRVRNVRKTTFNGQVYASMMEAERAKGLTFLLEHGLIAGWARQVTFSLGCPENRYRVDFLVFDMNGAVCAEDVKGMETDSFKKNKRLWKRYGPCPLLILKRVKKGGLEFNEEVVHSTASTMITERTNGEEIETDARS